MITANAFRGKRYAVLGLARSGIATVEALLASGAELTVWDENVDRREDAVDAAIERSQKIDLDAALYVADPVEIDLTGFTAVIVSPGVPLNKHPIAAHAKRFGVPVIGDIELFAQARAELPPHKVIGITGTNGKSTTTALIHHIVKTAGMPATLGGNIGLPILGQDPLPTGGVYVLELSSYQIDLTQSLDCDVAVLLNITPDHLDRYDGFEGYAGSKARLFAMQSAEHVAVIATEDEPTRKIADRLCALAKAGAQAEGQTGLLLSQEHAELVEVSSKDIADQARWPALRGPHNAQNVAAATAAARALDISDEAIEQGLRTYPGLPHRMERVAEKRGILYVNDSKATNATSTAPALSAYPHIHWILGGLPKTDDLDACKPGFAHVRAAYTIGQAGPMFARILREAGKTVTESITLDQAVVDASQAAQAGEVVLLSPACASFDQFKDYEARGDAFRAAVEGLPA